MKHCPNLECPHYRAVHSPAEYVSDLSTCPDCGGPLADGGVPEKEEAPEALPVPRPLALRLAVTLAVLPALFALRWIPLPGLDMEALLPVDAGVFALGLSPFVSAAAVVGLATLVVRRWRALPEHAAGRRKIGLATLGLTIVFATAQANGIAVLLGGMPEVFNGSVPMTVLTLVAGTMTLVAAAELLSRHGLGNGYAMLLGATFLARIVHQIRGAGDGGSGRALDLGVLVVFVYGLARILGARRRAALQKQGSPEAYRRRAAAPGDVDAQAVEPFVRLAASGVAPFVVAGYALGAVSFVNAVLLPPEMALRGALLTVLYAILVAAVALILSYGFHPAERLAHLWHRGDSAPAQAATLLAARAEVRTSALKSASLLGGIAGLASLAGPAVAESLIGLLVLTAAGMDLLAEWRARRASGELETVAVLHDPDSAEAAIAALGAAGHAVHARGLHTRAMLQVFGPYVPVALMVAEDRAAEAAAVVRPIVGEEPDAAAPVVVEKPKKRRRAKKTG